VNTSIVIRALNPKEPGHHEARRLLEECCKRCKCFWSTIHDLERMTPIQRLEFEGYLEGLGARKSHIDARRILARAEAYRLSIGAAESKLVDIMHMLAASLLGCRCILAVDRFIRARSGDFNLEIHKLLYRVWLMLSAGEWRRSRDKAGILLGLVLKAGNTDRAWQVYKQWANTEITYEEAKKRLQRLAGQAKA